MKTHPRVRGAAAHRDRHRRDPRVHAPVLRPGGGGGRGVRGTDRCRLHRQHPPRPRPLHRQGLRRAGHDEGDLRARATGCARARAARCTSRILPRACWARTPSSAAGRRWRSARRSPASSRGKGQVSVAFGGDGSCNQGTVFEAMNLAVVLQGARDLRVREQRLLRAHRGCPTRWARRTSPRARAGFGMPAETRRRQRFLRRLRGDAAGARRGRAPARAQSRSSPITTRFFGHFEGDPQRYRAKDEVAQQRARRWIA